MSLSAICPRMASLRFPRVSGDEPGQSFTFPAGFEFSPRERG